MTSDVTSHSAEARLPSAALLGLAASGFLCIVTETLPAGLLPRIARGLAISESVAGQLVGIYALGSLAAAIPLTTWTQGYRRRPVLVATILCFVVGNTVTAVAATISIVLVARFIAGCAAGLAWGILAGYARSIVRPEQTGPAMAVAMIGVPLALSLGVPAGTVLGGLVGWRGSFLILSGLALLLIAWILAKVPDAPGRPNADSPSLRAVVATPGVMPILLVVLAWMTAHNLLYTYVSPLSVAAGAKTPLVLLAFGASSFAGIWLVGRLIDRLLRSLVLLMIGSFVAIAILLAFVGPAAAPLVYAAAAVWGIGFGGAGAIMQTASADAAGDGVDLAQAMVTTAWNLAIATGGALGGVLLANTSIHSLPAIAAMLAALGFAIASAARHAFPPGPRRAAS